MHVNRSQVILQSVCETRLRSDFFGDVVVQDKKVRRKMFAPRNFLVSTSMGGPLANVLLRRDSFETQSCNVICSSICVQDNCNRQRPTFDDGGWHTLPRKGVGQLTTSRYMRKHRECANLQNFIIAAATNRLSMDAPTKVDGAIGFGLK